MSFGIYIHWPFCDRICPYCDFNVYRPRNADQSLWLEAYKQDLKSFAALTKNRTLNSIYLGGGTPSLMAPSIVQELLEYCDDLWGIEPNAEITLEANPTDAEIQKFSSFKNAGINRLSLGIQSLTESALKFLGRNHSATDALKALDLAQSIFPRVTIDLIYGLPDQSLTAWEKELERALQTGLSHISLYQLTVEPNTAFQKAVDRKEWQLPNDTHQADFFSLNKDLCQSYDLNRYEVSNHAKKGFESQHNFLYWRYNDYIGIGPGAHGRLTQNDIKHEILSELKLSPFLDGKFQDRYDFTPLTTDDEQVEKILMGLRLKEGISLTDCALPEEKLTAQIQNGFAVKEKDRLILTDAGLAVLNSIILELLS